MGGLIMCRLLTRSIPGGEKKEKEECVRVGVVGETREPKKREQRSVVLLVLEVLNTP